MRIFPVFFVVLALFMAGCDRHEEALFNPHEDRVTDETRKEIAADIAKLAKGKDADDEEGVAIHSDAVQRLTARGATVEPQMIEALNGSDDWNVRLGAIEVLESIGGKNCVDALIEHLADPVPLVARRAEVLLSTMCKHRVIPEAGQPESAEGLPPVPKRGDKQLALDSEEKIWAAWYKDHSSVLQKTWSEWWKANRNTVTIN